MPLGALLAVFGLLSGRAAAVGTGNIFFLLGLCLDLVVGFFLRTAAFAKGNAVFEYALKFVHTSRLMVEQANAGKCHRNAVFVASHDDVVVTD